MISETKAKAHYKQMLETMFKTKQYDVIFSDKSWLEQAENILNDKNLMTLYEKVNQSTGMGKA